MSKLCVGGDVFFDKKVIFDFPLMDIMMFNMEYAFCQEETASKKVLLKSDFDWRAMIPARKVMVSLANNHIMDGGIVGLRNTLKYLSEQQIPYFGAGNIRDNFNNPHFEKIESENVAFIGYCDLPNLKNEEGFGVAFFDKAKVIEDIGICRQAKANKIVVSIHWGEEESPMQTESQKEIAHWLIDLGCDFVIGHHSHCIQPYETYKNGHIFYSLGNFYFPDFTVNAFKCDKNPKGIIYRKKQLWWNKKSLFLELDVKQSKIDKICISRYKNNRVWISTEKSKKKKRFFPIGILYSRKILSMLLSNILVDGKIIDFAYFRNEILMFIKKIRSTNE